MTGSPRVSAYVLLADPSFLAESITAYYDRVDRIVLSFDRTATSWTGTPLPLAQCLEIVRGLDRDGKCVEAPGDFVRLDPDPLVTETRQRQSALDAASEGADWVLQLDTDEVMPDPHAFFGALARADDTGARGLDFPSRWLFTRVAPGRYIEATARLWRTAAGYPGPLAVRAGTALRLARQTDVPLYRVDVRSRNTDPGHPPGTPVDEVVRLRQAVLHFSWVRDAEVVRRKIGWSGHAGEMDARTAFQRWERSWRHPRRTTVSAVLPGRRWFRIASVPEPPGGAPILVRYEDDEPR